MEALQHLLQHSIPSMADLLRVGIWFSLLAILFIPLERLFALHPQKIFRKAVAVDVAYYFLNSLMPTLLVATPMAVFAWGLRHILPTSLHTWAEILPMWLRLTLGLIVGEFGYYWGHRFSHEIPWLWRFHSIHHSAEEMDWLVSTRGHPFDVAFGRLCGLIPMYVLGLAQPMNGANVDPTALIVSLLGTVWGFVVHANLRWRFEWLGLVISTPAFHHWHHTNDEHINRNYASMMPIWDKLFGTWFLPKSQWPPAYGIDTPMSPRLDVQLIQPFLDDGEAASLPAPPSPIASS